MVIVAVIGDVVEFVAVNEGMLPVPLAARPMAGLLFVHDHEVTFVPESGMEKIVLLQ